MPFRIDNDIEFLSTVPGGGQGNLQVGDAVSSNRRTPADVFDPLDTFALKIEENGKHETAFCTLISGTEIARTRVIDRWDRTGPQNTPIQSISLAKVDFSAGDLYCAGTIPQPMNIVLQPDGTFAYADAVRKTIFFSLISDIQAPASALQDGEVIVAISGLIAGDLLGGVFLYDASGDDNTIDNLNIFAPGTVGNPRTGILIRQELSIQAAFFTSDLSIYAVSGVSRAKLHLLTRGESGAENAWMGWRAQRGADYTDLDLVARDRQTAEVPFVRGRSYGDGRDALALLKPINLPAVATKTDVLSGMLARATDDERTYLNDANRGRAEILLSDGGLRATVANIADLRGLTPDGYQDGELVEVHGASFRGDGDKFLVYWSSGTTTADNGYDVFKPNAHAGGAPWTEAGRFLAAAPIASAKFADSDATPSVAGGVEFIGPDTAPAAITGFDDFRNNKTIIVRPGLVPVIFQHSASLVLRFGADMRLAPGDAPLAFRKENGVVRYLSGGGALTHGDGSTVAASSGVVTLKPGYLHTLTAGDTITGIDLPQDRSWAAIVLPTTGSAITLTHGGSPGSGYALNLGGTDLTLTPGDDAGVFIVTRVGTTIRISGGSGKIKLPGVGDGDGAGGGTDDSVAVQSSLDAATGGVFNGYGKIYRCDDSLTADAPIHIKDVTFDFTNLATDTDGLTIAGSLGSDISLTADAAAGATSITLASTAGLVVDQWLWLRSTAIWSPIDNSTFSEMVRIKALPGGGVVTLYDLLKLPYTTAASAKVNVLNFAEGVTLENVRFIGGGPGLNQKATRFEYMKGLRVIGGSTDGFDDRAYRIRTSFDCRFTEIVFDRARRAGFSYGIAIEDGCENITVTRCTGYDLRHMIATGGIAGINDNITATHNTGYNMRDALCDSHSSARTCNFSNNTVYMADGYPGTNGIICQGSGMTANENKVFNCQGIGVFHQPTQNLPAVVTSEISHNEIIGKPGGQSASIAVIPATGSGTAIIQSIKIETNICDHSTTAAIYVQALGMAINNVSIKGNTGKLGNALRGIQVRADGFFITRGVIEGNISLLTGDVGENIYLQAAVASAASAVTRFVVTENVINNGTTGIRSAAASGALVDYVVTNDNIIEGCTAAQTLAGSNNQAGTNLVIT